MTSVLDEAIAAHVEPGMTVFIDSTAMSATAALARVFRGTRPGLTVITPRGGMLAPELVRAEIVGKIVSGGLLNPHLGRVPPPVVQDAYRSGAVEFELSTLQTVGIRLMAGALGWPFVPSRSMAGSDLLAEHHDALAHVGDPFSAATVGVLRPLYSDVAIGHALLADRRGQAIFPDSSDHGGWGMRSARSGVIVVSERVVDDISPEFPGPRFVRPAHVLGTCEVPHAAAPYGFVSQLEGVVSGYPPDSAALQACARELRSDSAVARSQGLAARGRADEHAWTPRRSHVDARPSTDMSIEESVYFAGAELVRSIVERGRRTVLEGSGKASLITKYAVGVAGRWGVRVERVGGISGLNGTPLGRSPIEAYCWLIGGLGARSVSVLSALQVDQTGSINNTELDPGPTLLVGSGGANDAGSMCDEVIVITSGHPNTLVARVQFVTVPGDRVSAIVAGRCLFERQDGAFTCTKVLGSMTPDVVELLEHARRVGFRVCDHPTVVPAPTPAERDEVARFTGTQR